MTQYIIRRVLSMFLVLLVVSMVTFVFMRAMPGNPFDSERTVPERVIRQLEQKYRLDLPVWQQFVEYIGGVAVPRITDNELPRSTLNDYLINIYIPGVDRTLRIMNFGPSYTSYSQSVNDYFRERLPVSFQLGLGALFVAMIIGIPAGIIAALRRNTGWDYFSMSLAIIGVSVPVIVSGPILQYFFGVRLGIAPVTFQRDLYFASLVMPAFALGFSASALLARLTRASLLQVLNEDYIRTARAKGVRERLVITYHALKNAMIPVVTVLGPLFAALVTGSFVTEIIFGIPGIGEFFVSSITNRDYPVIMGVTLLYGFFLVFSNLVVDLVYAWLDPRITYS
jgi:ABC-type dipeptide/oligopeptide/nickel transport system permease component